MEFLEIYRSELLKPAHASRSNHGYLILGPEKNFSIYSSIDKVIKEIESHEPVQVEFPQKEGLLYKKGRIIRYAQVTDNQLAEFHSKLRAYRKK